MSLLTVTSLEARHGLLVAVRDLDLSIGAGEVLAIVGANGAGKTTLLRCIAGSHAPSAGRIDFDGDDVTRLPAHRRVARGIALVPEGRRLFADMTVAENLSLGATAARAGAMRLETVLDALPQLKPLLRRRAGRLSGGEQQAAAIGRALMSNPRLLLLDEVSLGLSPVAVERVYAALPGLIAAGTTIVLVEQDLKRAMASARRVICMLEGRIVLEGAASSLTRRQVTDAYFGLGESTAHGTES
jgi:branched-chain amino acid transport system ATP-binding protein